MNVYALVHGRILDALKALQAEGVLPPGLDFSSIEVLPPRDAAHGDLACNAALVLARRANMKPRAIAELAADKLRADPDLAKLDVAGAGFLNLTFRPEFWQRIVAAMLQEKGAYARADIGRREKVNIEYVSANPTGPMHVGHGRGAVFGDALANLLAFVGYEGRANIMSTTLGRRWKRSPARRSCATARPWARRSGRSLQGFILATTCGPSAAP